MSDFSNSPRPPEAKVISLVERRNKDVFELLKELHAEVVVVEEGVQREYDEIKLMSNLPFLEDSHINDKVTDLNIVKKNKEITKETDGYVTSGKEITQKIHDLIIKIRDGMDFLYNTKFKKLMKASHVMSEMDVEADFNFINSNIKTFDEQELADTPALVSLKVFIPGFLEYLSDIDFGIKKFAKVLSSGSPNSEELKKELYQVQNQVQGGLKYAEYFLDLFEKHNPTK
jgi:hypothetical protein